MSWIPSRKVICIFCCAVLMACSGVPSKFSARDDSSRRVLVRVLVKADGTAADAKVVESSGSEKIDNIALDAMKRAKYRPYLKDGVAEDTSALVPVNVDAQ